MKTERRREIEDYANTIRAHHGVNDKSMLDFVKHLGGTVSVILEGMGSYPGVYKVKDSFHIKILNAKGIARDKDIVHMLGHLYVHMGFGVDATWKYASDYIDDLAFITFYTMSENEAEAFAKVLLSTNTAYQNLLKRDNDRLDEIRRLKNRIRELEKTVIDGE